MDPTGIDYVPASYRCVDVGHATLWVRDVAALQEAPVSITELVESSVVRVLDLLDFSPTRHIHVVMYSDVEDSFRALGRKVAPTMFLAPLHTSTHAVIVLHSWQIDPSNADLPRSQRHLCHEVAHVAAAERSGSLKRLGDGNARMRIRSWVNEGFAECVAAVAANRQDIVDRARQAASGVEMAWQEIDAALDDLVHPARGLAFAVATTVVWRAVKAHGFPLVFAHLDEPSVWSTDIGA